MDASLVFDSLLQIKTGIRGNLDTGNKLTNREILATMDASVNMLPYVYDTFKWDHCLGAGIDFDDAWVVADELKRTGTSKPNSRQTLKESGREARSSHHSSRAKNAVGRGGGRKDPS